MLATHPDPDRSRSLDQGGVLAIGTFDGVHLAHQALVGRAVERARELGVPSYALTFEPHPKEFLLPRAPPRLTSAGEKARRLREAGADGVLSLPFDADLAALPEEEFVREVLIGRFRARGVVVGFNFSFGYRGRGRPEDLARLCEQHGVSVEVLEAQDIDGIPVSSTSIRVLLRCGDVEAAAQRMGRPHLLEGRVVHGEKRGRQLGFPTANMALEPENLLAPGHGVYAGVALLPDGGTSPCVVNVGRRPTFHEEGASGVEVHCLDYTGHEFYGEPLSVELVRRLRGEQPFPSREALRDQIAVDISRALEALGTRSGGKR